MKIFLFYFEMAIKVTGSAQNYGVGRVSGNTPFFRSNVLATWYNFAVYNMLDVS